MALRFFAQGSATESVLAAMIVVFVVALSQAGRHFSQNFAEALKLRFELNEVNLRLREANLRLQAEIAEHRATEAALHQAQKLEAMGYDGRHRPRFQQPADRGRRQRDAA